MSTPTEHYSGCPEDLNLIANVCRALSHVHRLSILSFVHANPNCTAGALAAQLPIAASTVSQHLTLLRQSGLISCTHDGPRRRYRVEQDLLDRWADLATIFVSSAP